MNLNHIRIKNCYKTGKVKECLGAKCENRIETHNIEEEEMKKRNLAKESLSVIDKVLTCLTVAFGESEACRKLKVMSAEEIILFSDKLDEDTEIPSVKGMFEEVEKEIKLRTNEDDSLALPEMVFKK